MPLDLEQLRVLAQLKRSANALKDAHTAYEAAEGRCLDFRISTRQIAVVADLESHATVWRRHRKRVIGGAR